MRKAIRLHWRGGKNQIFSNTMFTQERGNLAESIFGVAKICGIGWPCQKQTIQAKGNRDRGKMRINHTINTYIFRIS